MILPVLKFNVFSLAPFLLLLWSTLPDLWSKITSSARLVGDHPSSLLNFPSGLLLSGEAVVKSLTCDDLDLNVVNYILPSTKGETTSVPPPFSQNESVPVPPEVLEIPPSVISCAPWVITGLVLMGLNSYFPQLSPVSSFWSPLRAAIPVLHWVASWWFLSLGWETDFVSLAPLSYTLILDHTVVLLMFIQDTRGISYRVIHTLIIQLSQDSPNSQVTSISI
ncbi:hypothetical protein DSO57_1009778 [Entomophthora muscae]|uniref:Uncharacterized protein n=1 Tax=Entomophthora muscae TaxID=34485 RepID=A0ACC2S8N9_9FUNG|nr:hypothetical protein DSO57_1009778 [Entomophthora muscae]